MSLPRLLPLQPRRATGEPIVPMINVVFLLLVFFLMTSQIAPPAPIEVAPPRGEAEAQNATAVLYIGRDGDTRFADMTGASALSAAASQTGALAVTADRALSGAELARILGELARLGALDIELTVAP